MALQIHSASLHCRQPCAKLLFPSSLVIVGTSSDRSCWLPSCCTQKPRSLLLPSFPILYPVFQDILPARPSYPSRTTPPSCVPSSSLTWTTAASSLCSDAIPTACYHPAARGILFFFFLNWGVIGISHYISFRCRAWWFDICIYGKRILISLDSICHHTWLQHLSS